MYVINDVNITSFISHYFNIKTTIFDIEARFDWLASEYSRNVYSLCVITSVHCSFAVSKKKLNN